LQFEIRNIVGMLRVRDTLLIRRMRRSAIEKQKLSLPGLCACLLQWMRVTATERIFIKFLVFFNRKLSTRLNSNVLTKRSVVI